MASEDTPTNAKKFKMLYWHHNEIYWNLEEFMEKELPKEVKMAYDDECWSVTNLN